MKKLLVVFLLTSLMALASQNNNVELWEPLRFLEGIWTGQGEGMSGISTVNQEYRFILNGEFLQMTTRSELKPQEKNQKSEIHEDIGFFSFDHTRKKFMLRGFYVEGFINQYVGDISEDGKTITFETEAIENAPPGTRAKLVFQQTSRNELEQSFFVAWPERDFSCMSTNRLKRK